MVDKIVQLVDKDNNNIYPLSRGVAADSIDTNALQDGAVTALKIDAATLKEMGKVVYDYTLTSTVSSGFTVSGLDLVGDGGVYDMVITTTGTSSDFNMKFNGDTGICRQMVGVNITTTYVSTDVDSVTSTPKYRGVQSKGVFYGFGAYGDTMITATICRINGHIHMQYQTSVVMNGNQRLYNGTAVTNNTIDNLTSLYFQNAVPAGTRILITKRTYITGGSSPTPVVLPANSVDTAAIQDGAVTAQKIDSATLNSLVTKEEISKELFYSAAGTSGNVLLNDNNTNYDYLEIFYEDDQNNQDSIKIFETTGSVMISMVKTASVSGTIYLLSTKYTWSGNNTLVPSVGTILNLNSSGVQVNPSSGTNLFKITKVLGIKLS